MYIVEIFLFPAKFWPRLWKMTSVSLKAEKQMKSSGLLRMKSIKIFQSFSPISHFEKHNCIMNIPV